MRNGHAQNRAQGAALTPANLWGFLVFIVPQVLKDLPGVGFNFFFSLLRRVGSKGLKLLLDF
jgi:hypothetical protein